MSDPHTPEAFSLLLLDFSTKSPPTYSVEELAQHAGMHPEVVKHYCRLGLFGEQARDVESQHVFDDNTIYELRRFELYRRQHGVNRRTLRLLCMLWREVDRLETELRFLRGP